MRPQINIPADPTVQPSGSGAGRGDPGISKMSESQKMKNREKHIWKFVRRTYSGFFSLEKVFREKIFFEKIFVGKMWATTPTRPPARPPVVSWAQLLPVDFFMGADVCNGSRCFGGAHFPAGSRRSAFSPAPLFADASGDHGNHSRVFLENSRFRSGTHP